MKKIILINGLIAGVIVASLMDASVIIIKDFHEFGMVIGYLSMLIAFSFVYIGVKKYRDNELGGVIKFGRAFTVGFGIALIASIIYVINWEVYMYLTNYTFMAEYSQIYIEGLRAKGKAAAEIAKAQAEMATMIEAYKNPIYRMGMTLTEILPIGIIVSLIIAWVVRNPKGKAKAA